VVLCSLCLVAPCLCATIKAHEFDLAEPSATEAFSRASEEGVSGDGLTSSLVDLSRGVHGGEKTARLKEKYDYYHTSEELAQESRELVSKCGGMASIETVQRGDVVMDVITVRDKEAHPANRVFMLFGEHSRELISPESGLGLLKMLCGEAQPTDGTPSAKTVLQDSEFRLVLNANSRSRKLVEQGQYCLRENPNGVDLNRNWDEKWSNHSVLALTNPGPTPFSEIETQILRDDISAYKPTTFVTIHSGTFGMYMPWAFDTTHLATRNEESMMQVLKDVDQKHCQCPFGAAGKEVGYSCPGTCLDWVYDHLEAPYAFAFEIFTNGDAFELTERWREKLANGGASLLQQGEHLAHPHFHDVFTTHFSDFVQVSDSLQATLTNEQECFDTFNPSSRKSFDETIQNWASAYLETAHKVAAKLKEETR